MHRSFLLAICIAGIPVVAGASTWTVTNTQDGPIGVCDSDCTLREALTFAGNGDVINFAPGVTGTITLGGAGELFIQHNITINGPGANVLAVSGANATRVFEIKSGFTLTMSGLTITNGFVSGAGGEGQGAGILNNGKLNLTACELTTNNINMTDSGGGAGRALGGGLFNGNGSTAVIRNCTFDFNGVRASQAWGGGMASRSASVIAINSTFSNNVLKPDYAVKAGDGGGVFCLAATVTLVNCTIAFNTYVPGGTATGGGIERTVGGAVFVWNTVIAGNSADLDPDAAGSFSSLGHNLVGNSTGSSSWVSSDKLDAAAAPVNLGGLIYNGGPTKTHAIAAGSVAIDAADDTAKDPGADGVYGTADDVPVTVDQRRYPRPVGAHLDIGAFEFETAQSGPTFTVTTTDEHSDGFCGVGDCSLWDAANAADSNTANNSVITFAPQVVGTITVTLQPSGMNLTRPMTIVGPGARTLTISGANVGRILNVQSTGVVISGLTFANGHFTSDGGAILNNNGDVSLTDCAFLNNVVAGAGSSGGAIANETNHKLSLRNCTFGGNQASGRGGGVYDGAGSLAATDCTFTGNTAVIGGGVFIQTGFKSDTFNILNCTLSGNTATVASPGTGGGGIFTTSNNVVSIGNTIVAGNTAPAGNPDASGPYSSLGSNLIGDGSGSSGFTAAGDQVGTSAAPINPKLDTLKNNGGATDTMALLSGSSAIDAGNDTIAPASDQRGVARSGKSDIGAFEFIPLPTPTPTATPAGFVANVSTRLPVGTNENVLIEGFIVQGPAGSTKKIIIRAIGPSLVPFGITDALANPTLEIHDESGLIAVNNDWKVTQTGGIIAGDQSAEIGSSGVAPSNDLESAIIANLAPGSYTAVVQGAGGSTGTGVVDAYDLSAGSPARLANIATRGLVQPGDQLMIAGFIIQNGPVRAVVRGIGPSLVAFGINNALPDTTLQLRDQNGTLVVEDDDWKVRADGSSQQAEIEATGLQPSNDLEAAFVTTLPPGQYTAQLRGKPEQAGIGVVQVYFLQ